MADTAFRGPVANLGATMDTSISPTDGPNLTYQGMVFIDPRFTPANKDSIAPGVIPAFISSPYVTIVNNIPSLLSSTVIAAAQVATSGTAMALATAVVNGAVAGTPSVVPGIPIQPAGTTSTVSVTAIDFGFATGTTAANSTTVVVLDSVSFPQGMWIVIAGAGNSSASGSLITQVATATNGTTILVTNAAGTALSNTPIGAGNLWNLNTPPGTQFGPQTASANAAQPYFAYGVALGFDARQAMTRNITVQAATVNGGTATILVAGYDIYGNSMTELLTATGTTLVNGKKAFKYVSSVVPSASGSAVYTIGIGDVVGIPLRANNFNQIGPVVLGNNVQATAAGFTAAVTSVANNTSGDVRGTLALNLLGGAIATSNNTARLSIEMRAAFLSSTPTNYTALFGVPQA